MTQDLLDSIKDTFEQADLSSKNFDASSLFAGTRAEDDVQPLREWALGKGMAAKAFDDAKHVWFVEQSLGEYPVTVEDYVRLYITREELAAQFNGLINGPRRGAVMLNHDLNSMGRELRLLNGKLGLPFRDKGIADALDQWLAESKHKRLEAAFEATVSTVPVNADAEWLKFSEALADTNAVSARYVACVVKAGIWQVKRKLADDPALPVHDHLMPVLSGPQGSGKTSVIRLLFGPVSDLVAATNFSEITDERNQDLWSYPILLLDEMEAADRSDVESIKNAITRETKSGRLLHTNSTATVRNRATFWGCTNGMLGDKIADTSGLRRFAPIPVKHSPTVANLADGLPVVDWQSLNAVDYLSLWQSVDHTAAHPLRSDLRATDEWALLCEAERQQDSVESWLRHVDRDVLRFIPGRPHTTAELYAYEDGKGYADWCKRNGMSAVGVGKFGKRLASLCSLTWYPFEAPKAAKRGTVHALKELIKLAA